MKKAIVLIAVACPLLLCCVAERGDVAHAGDTPSWQESPESQYLVACDDPEAIDAIRSTFLVNQWIMVAILTDKTGKDAKQGIGGCVLHIITDPLSFAITGKYVYPLRPPPRDLFVLPQKKRKLPMTKPTPGVAPEKKRGNSLG